MVKDMYIQYICIFFTFALLSLLHFVNGVNCGHMDTVQDIQ